MQNFNPRHLRKKFANTGGKDIAKQRAFRAAAKYSKRFIHQSASFLESPAVAPQYADWCNTCSQERLRKGSAK